MARRPKALTSRVLRTLGLLGAIATCIALAAGLAYLNHAQTPLLSLLKIGRSTPAPEHRIAIFLGADIPALNMQRDGIVAAMKRYNMNFEERTYYYDQNQALLTHQILTALNNGADLLVTVGTIASQTAHRILQKHESKAQLLFSCVLDPVGSGISETKYYTGANSTGFSDEQSNDMSNYVRALRVVRPNVQKVLIVYSPHIAMLENQVKAIRAELKKQHIIADKLEVFNCGEVYEKARQKIKKDTDMVIILRDYTTTSAIQSLIRLCKQTQTTLFTADKHSVEQGAAAGFSVDEYNLGVIIGHYVQSILEKGIPAHRLPITYLMTANLCRLHINPFALEEQGVTVPIETFMSYDRVNILQA